MGLGVSEMGPRVVGMGLRVVGMSPGMGLGGLRAGGPGILGAVSGSGGSAGSLRLRGLLGM